MTIDWQHFTPYSALAGGAIIGGAVALLLLFNGRIAGISGITGGVLSAAGQERGWRAAFIGGLLLSPWLYAAVGLGTRLGSGCTSGHGVCGVARLAPRSLAATAVFMLLGFMTVWLMRHLAGG